MTKMMLICVLKCKYYFLRNKSWGCFVSHWASFGCRMHLSHLKNQTDMTFFEFKISRCFQTLFSILFFTFFGVLVVGVWCRIKSVGTKPVKISFLTSQFVSQMIYLRNVFSNWRFVGHKANYSSASGMGCFFCWLTYIRGGGWGSSKEHLQVNLELE